jgi:hypothetical protein
MPPVGRLSYVRPRPSRGRRMEPVTTTKLNVLGLRSYMRSN